MKEGLLRYANKNAAPDWFKLELAVQFHSLRGFGPGSASKIYLLDKAVNRNCVHDVELMLFNKKQRVLPEFNYPYLLFV